MSKDVNIEEAATKVEAELKRPTIDQKLAEYKEREEAINKLRSELDGQYAKHVEQTRKDFSMAPGDTATLEGTIKMVVQIIKDCQS